MLLKLLENIFVLVILIAFIGMIAGLSYWKGAANMRTFTLDNLSVTINNKTHKCDIRRN